MKTKAKTSSSDALPGRIGASFRDPAGQIVRTSTGAIYREINEAGLSDYHYFIDSGLYKKLADRKLVVSHKTVKPSALRSHAPLVIKPEKIEVITYPFEWSFSQLRDAALLTLKIQKIALSRGMILKDASAYNVQFLRGKPVFIDTLSFETYENGMPWVAYRQFCQHFLAPLALMAYTDVSLQQLLRVWLDGVPLPLTNKLLPRVVKVKPGIMMHLVLHGRFQTTNAQNAKKTKGKVSKRSLLAIITSLENTVARLKAPKDQTEWADYYSNTNYSDKALLQKANLVRKLVKPLGLQRIIDIGGNDGHFSRILQKDGYQTVCVDIDPNAVEKNYVSSKAAQNEEMLPMLADITNPGGYLGWGNQERSGFHERVKGDAVLALALIHHLAISNNIPMEMIASYLSKLGSFLVIEFVPKQDSQVQKLLATRKDVFDDYHEAGFESAFTTSYRLVSKSKIPGTKRTLYLFKTSRRPS